MIAIAIQNSLIHFPIIGLFIFLTWMNGTTRSIFVQVVFVFSIFSWAYATQSELDLSKEIGYSSLHIFMNNSLKNYKYSNATGYEDTCDWKIFANSMD